MKKDDDKDFIAKIPPYPTTDIQLTEEQIKELDEAMAKVLMNTDM